METAEFTIFNNELRFHFSDQNLLDLTLGSRGFFSSKRGFAANRQC